MSESPHPESYITILLTVLSEPGNVNSIISVNILVEPIPDDPAFVNDEDITTELTPTPFLASILHMQIL